LIRVPVIVVHHLHCLSLLWQLGIYDCGDRQYLIEMFLKISRSPWPPLAMAPDNHHLSFLFLLNFFFVNDLVLLSDWKVLLLVTLSFKRVLAY
jgi:hypothetical protein